MRNKHKLIPFDTIRKEWMKDPEYRHAYEKLEPEFQIARAIINARIKRNISQAELAEKVGTGQAVISRLETMTAKPSLSLLQRVADALGLRTEIRFVQK